MRSVKNGSPQLLNLPVLAARDTVLFPGQTTTLHVVREGSLRAVKRAQEDDQTLLVLSQADMSVDEPRAKDLSTLGTVAEVMQSIPLPDGSVRIALRGIYRGKPVKFSEKGGLIWTEAEQLAEISGDPIEAEALSRSCINEFTSIVQQNDEIPPESLRGLYAASDPGMVADSIIQHLPLSLPEKQTLLELVEVNPRLHKLLELLKRELQVLSLRKNITTRVEAQLGDSQREYYLREQLKVIQDELRVFEDRLSEHEEYLQRIKNCGIPSELEPRVLTELQRLERTPTTSPEGLVIRNYLDTVINLPWQKTTEDHLSLQDAAALLDRKHFGLQKAKERILDYLAVRTISKKVKGPILCFVGPPGVGKTSFGESIAEAMGRRFARIALGGVRDESEIRGHRRTYVGSMPGRIIQALLDAGSRNPVILLDEIDKLGQGSHGDPTSALLEVLDPNQNSKFVDHYVDVPFDLSDVIFVATANLLERIPSALWDRMEAMPFHAYTQEERERIAEQFLIPKSLEEHGLTDKSVQFEKLAFESLITEYSRESGVRQLGRAIATICRKSARQMVDGKCKTVKIDDAFLLSALGPKPYPKDKTVPEGEVGVAWGLVIRESGGDVVPFEITLLPAKGDRGQLMLTGLLGEVMRESAQAALTFVQSRATELGIKDPAQYDIHLHVPEGAVPKDGPSAGITLAIVFSSALSGRPVRKGITSTGEITLRGRVLAVGGVRDKVLAAIAHQRSEVYLPQDCEPDLNEVLPSISEKIKVHFISEATQAILSALQSQ